MQILSVSLKNFKIHRDRRFEFQPGINAICGENGAGKTSIVEAIAWALFNFSNDYRKEELRYQGSSNAQVTVSFISASDGRTYQVQRQTSKGKSDSYLIYDPQLNTKIDGIYRIEDALQWLHQHLGIPAQTDLARLFGDVIGIPQGTFTTDFLKSATERRKVFDPILQVEEYKQAYQLSSNLEKYGIVQVQQLEQDISSYHDRLQDWQTLKQQHQDIQRTLGQGEASLKELIPILEAQQQELDKLKAQVEKVKEFGQQIELMRAKIEGLEQYHQQQERDIQRAQAAKSICETHQIAYETYQKIAADLKVLSEQRDTRDRLYREQTLLLGHINKYKVQEGQLKAQIEQLELVHHELETLAPDIPKQEAAEDQRQAIAEQLQKLEVHRVERERFLQQQAQYQEQFEIVQTDITYLQRLESAVIEIPAIESELQRCREQLTHLDAVQTCEAKVRTIFAEGQSKNQAYRQQVKKSLEALQPIQEAISRVIDSQGGHSQGGHSQGDHSQGDHSQGDHSQGDHLQGVAPLNQVAETLQVGEKLLNGQMLALQNLLYDLAAQTDESTLQSQIQSLAAKLEGAKQCQLEFARLATQLKQRDHLGGELDRIRLHLERLKQALVSEEELHNQHQHVQMRLVQLGDPKGRTRILQQQLQAETTLRQQWETLQQQDEKDKAELARVTTDLQDHDGIDGQIKAQEEARATCEPHYLEYVQHKKIADALTRYEQEFAEVHNQLQQMRKDLQVAEELFAEAWQDFNPEVLKEPEQKCEALKSQKAQLEGALPEQRKTLQQLTKELQQRETWAAEWDHLQRSLSNKQQVLQFIQDARRVYNQSGVRITNFYLDEVRREGDRLFRELMNRQSVALNWTEDYEIQVQEEGIWRGFRTLSGGEQMAAALAVRLALLKVLAEMDIAFFDEPTMSMDRDRREQLAEALGNLRTFRQLFIISHDDAFESLTENVIRVEREM